MHIGRGDWLWNRPFSQLSDLHDLGSGHTADITEYTRNISLINLYVYKPNFIKIGKNVDTQMDRRWDWLYYKDSEELT